jgi:hypothetical protein
MHLRQAKRGISMCNFAVFIDIGAAEHKHTLHLVGVTELHQLKQ